MSSKYSVPLSGFQIANGLVPIMPPMPAVPANEPSLSVAAYTPIHGTGQPVFGKPIVIGLKHPEVRDHDAGTLAAAAQISKPFLSTVKAMGGS